MKTLIKSLQALTVVMVLVIAIGMTYAAKQTDQSTPTVNTQEQATQHEADTLDASPVSLNECPDQMC